MVRLVKPSKQYFDQIIELKKDFITNNEPRIQGSGSLDKYDDLNEWLKSINEIEQGLNPKLVPTTYYLILLDNEVVGTISMRHYLTKDLEEFGGHIGYSIKPRARRKGYAKEALRILLDLYKDKYDEILIMCEDDNIASNKTVLANGGVLINKKEKFGLNINRYKVIGKLQNLLIKKIYVNNKEECHELIDYAKNCGWQSTGEYLAELIENNEFTDSEIVIVAYLRNKVVGFAALVNDSVAENFNESPFLDFLFVEEEYRNRGIATKLVNYIVDYAKEKYDTIYLVTVSHELFYKKLGFETIAKSTVIDCIDECFIMKKEI